MKKIIIIILSLMYLNVYGETFYTNYYLIEQNTDIYHEEYINNELFYVEEKEVFQNYQQTFTSLGYFKKEQAPQGYAYYDSNDYITEIIYSESPFNKKESIYNTNCIRRFTEVKTFIFNSFNSNAYLKGINIKYKNEYIDYNYVINSYNSHNILSSDDLIVVDLIKPYLLKDLTIEFIFEDSTQSQISFNISLTSVDYNNANIFDEYSIKVPRNNETETFIIDFISRSDFNAFLKNFPRISEFYYYSTYSIPYYKKILYKYNYYSSNNKYLDIYTDKPLDNCKLDYNKKKKLYDYYKREYITINDEISSLSDLGLITSIPEKELSIETNGNLLIIKYQNQTFYKKIDTLEEEIPNNKKPSYKTNTKKELKEQSLSNQTTTKPSISFISKDNSLIDTNTPKKDYKYIILIIIFLLSIMCKLFVFKRNKKI